MANELAKMKKLHLRLMSFGGSNVSDFGWSNNPKELGAKMASVRCRQGLTRYLQSLNTFLDDDASDLQAIILKYVQCRGRLIILLISESLP